MADLASTGAGAATVDTAKTFVTNINAAREYRGKPAFAEIARLAKQHGHKLVPSHVGRVFAGSHSPTLDYVAGIAAGLDYAPWQLLVPGFKADDPPTIVTAAQAKFLANFMRPPSQ